MNKNYLTLTALAVVGGMAASTAQADVILSGRLKGALENAGYVAPSGVSDQEKGIYNRTSLNNESSFVRISGTEDLGGGISAFFQVETGFDVSGSNTGNALGSSLTNDVTSSSQSGRIGTRNTAFGFSGTAGTLFFGKWDLYYDTVYYVEPGNLSLPNKTSSLSLSSTTYGGVAIGNRYNNVISYTTPANKSGVTLQLATALGNESVVTPGSFNAYMGTLKYQDSALVAFGSVLATKQTTPNAIGTSLNNTFARVGGSYKLALSDASWLQFGALIETYRLRNTGSDLVAKESRTSFAVPVGLNFGATTIVATYGMAGKVKQNDSTIADSRAQYAMVGANYDISKRTGVGIYAAEIFNGKAANSDFYTSNTQLTKAPNSGYGYKPRAIGVSFRHLF